MAASDQAITQTESASQNLPLVVADPSMVARIKSDIDLGDRAQIATYGDGARRSVTAFADKILQQTRNREMGDTGKLLIDI